MAAFLIWGGMLFSPVVWFAGTHRNIVHSLLPLWILGISIATAYTGLMSVLSLVPLIALLLGTIYNFVKHFTKISKVSHYLTHAVAIFLVTLFVPYALTGRQLLFYKDVFTSPTPLKSSRMQGISLSPEFAIGMDELIDFVSQLPSDETIGLIPTEDPIYFATARKSPLHIVQRFTETGGNPVNLYLPELDRVKPNWVFQKVSVQFFLWEPISGAERQWLITNYSPAKRLKNYLVWKRKELEKPKN